jgi:hypothetical protein
VSSIAGLTDRCTVAAYVIANTTRLNGPNYTTSRDVTVTRCVPVPIADRPAHGEFG